jgi:hypothetical protein
LPVGGDSLIGDVRQMTGKMGNIGLHLPSPAKLIVVSLFISLLFGQSGCATSEPKTPPLSLEVKEKLGTVGVTSAHFLPNTEIEQVEKEYGVGGGALRGALHCLSDSAGADPYDILLGVALAPVCAVVGGIAGAWPSGMSSKQKKEAEEFINKATSELKIQDTMRGYVLQAAKENTCSRLVPFDMQGRDAPGKEVDYRFLIGEGIDTVLEISVTAFGMKGKNPPLYFFMTLHTRLVKTSGSTVLYTQDLRCRSASWTLSEWVADDAKLFREEFNFCYQDLAERVVKGIFLPCKMPVKSAQQSGSNGEDKNNHLK